MGTKFGLILGLGIGYVLGTRAGREQYERIRAGASRLRQVPVVAKPLDRAGEKLSDVVRAQGEAVTDKVAEAVKERLFGMPADGRSSSGSAGASGSSSAASAPGPTEGPGGASFTDPGTPPSSQGR
ncbi:MAG: YtxH domain-containing protein [Actinomycetaceae bacterium]|nr:YtxH domain-containing protein [Actinomycetaceae bacterium]